MESIAVFSAISGLALSWVILSVVTPMLTTPFQLGNLHANFPFSLDWPYLVGLFFQILIVVMISFAVVHNGLDLINKAAVGYVRNKEGPKVKRMDLNQRIQHMWLFVTTGVLALTGFAQLYYVGWGSVVINAMGGLAISMDVHLLAALLLGVLVVYHFAFYSTQYLYRRARGLPAPLKVMVTMTDITDALHNMKHMLGLTKEAPKYGKYDYAQKLDYWGIYWGMIILGVPGVLLWAYGYTFLDGLPFIFHTDEALLAVLFLLVFHFYQTHWNPREFPMNTIFLTGTLSEEEMRDQHPLELERLEAVGEA